MNWLLFSLLTFVQLYDAPSLPIMLLAFAPLWFTRGARYWLEDKVSKFGHAKQSTAVCSEQCCHKIGLKTFYCIHYVCRCNFKLLKGKMLGHNHDNKLAVLVSACSHVISCLTGEHNALLRALLTNVSQWLLKMVNNRLWWPLCFWQESSLLIT